MADIVEEIIKDVEGEFAPRPGGLVDRHRQEKARREAAAHERENVDERQEEHGYKSVKVTVLSPEVFSNNSVVIPSGASAMVLPYSPYRCRATIMSPVPLILAKDSGAALAGVGFPLPANTLYVCKSRAQLWASSPGIAQPAVPAVGVPVQNTTQQSIAVTLIGGSGLSAAVNNVSVGNGDGTFLVPSGQAILLNYASAPTWIWGPGSNIVSVLAELYAPEV